MVESLEELEAHRAAYRAVMKHMPGSEYLSHETNLEAGWDVAEVKFPIVITLDSRGCPTCGDPPEVAGLTYKCRDWHDICSCGQPYDQPKAKGCRRRKHPKPGEEK